MPRSSKKVVKPNKSSLPATARLPVNPRRKKVAPDQRKRVATACNSCNLKRIKCSGESPCSQCIGFKRSCLYPGPSEKVSIARGKLKALVDLNRSLEALLRQNQIPLPPGAAESNNINESLLSPDPEVAAPQSPVSAGGSQSGAGTSTSTAECESQRDDVSALGFQVGLGLSVTDGTRAHADSTAGSTSSTRPRQRQVGKMLADKDGTSRYLGPTSGATYLDGIKEFMKMVEPVVFHIDNQRGAASGYDYAGNSFLESVGQYQTFDSRPLLLHSHSAADADPRKVPSPTDMSRMLRDLRDFIQDGSGAYPCGGIFFWPLRDLEDVNTALHSLSLSMKGQAGRVTPGQNERDLALYHAAFAFASLLRTDDVNSGTDGHLGESYFARARALLGNPLEIASYTSTDVSVYALMALYLIENNRRDTAYLAVSHAMHVSMSLGIHEGWSDEAGRRSFWTVYILDRWLSCLMGRPPAIQDDAIVVPEPQEVPGLPSPAGLQAHIDLVKISNYIVYNGYRPRNADQEGTDAVPQNTLEILENWETRLPSLLKIPLDVYSLPITDTITDRACCSLHMSYNQLTILTVRPAFLTAVKKVVAAYWLAKDWTITEHSMLKPIRKCSDAARRNLRLGSWLRTRRTNDDDDDDVMHTYKLMLPDLHHIFNAAIILLLHQIAFLNLRTHDNVDIAFAIDTFASEAATGNDYAKDCAKVLRDLQALVRVLRDLIFNRPEERVLLSPVLGLVDAGGDQIMGAVASKGDTPAPPSLPAELAQQFNVWFNDNAMQLYDRYYP
ncbi:hypothetical protein B0T22DRAFT_33298 [Podospora appendiculata]|uniref:Zn(2)-C6 fungal-type domain-containing protein n=1 Tax=Podospora appendiculata TaxID=314037 RepID=A0AAE0XGZ8_9PEZI|nr:hypothetical protein B0T22DRAFT_33298 [Podospora appendiculata]